MIVNFYTTGALMFMVFKELVIHTSIISIKGVLNDFYSVYGGFVYVYGKMKN